MGLDMYLSRVPKVNTLEDLKAINDRLDNAFVNNTLLDEMKAIKVENNYIYDIDFSIESYVDIEKWKEDKEGWGHIISLEIRAGYWRKFNALHKWFVDNVQDGVDDCGMYIVTDDHFKKLQSDLSQLTKANANDIMPTQSGFFFGNTEIDEYYWNNIERLKNFVGYILSQDFHGTMYVYQSSW